MDGLTPSILWKEQPRVNQRPLAVAVQSRGDALSQGVFRWSLNHPVTVAAAGIQRSVCYLLPLPSSSPWRGSRALTMRQHGKGNNDARPEPGQDLHSANVWVKIRVLDPRCGEDDGG